MIINVGNGWLWSYNQQTGRRAMKAILIDPQDRRISPIEIDRDDTLQSLYQAIGCSLVQVGITLSDLGGFNHDVIVDEEGLFNTSLKYFSIRGQIQPLAGKAVILRSTEDGDWVDCRMLVEQLAPLVRFLTAREVESGFDLCDEEREKFYDECHQRGIVVVESHYRPYQPPKSGVPT